MTIPKEIKRRVREKTLFTIKTNSTEFHKPRPEVAQDTDQVLTFFMNPAPGSP